MDFKDSPMRVHGCGFFFSRSKDAAFVAPGLTRNKKLLGPKGIATSSKDDTKFLFLVGQSKLQQRRSGLMNSYISCEDHPLSSDLFEEMLTCQRIAGLVLHFLRNHNPNPSATCSSFLVVLRPWHNLLVQPHDQP